jgi:hypothetical protein
MSDLFDVSKEIILITGASLGLARQVDRVLSWRRGRAQRVMAGSC